MLYLVPLNPLSFLFFEFLIVWQHLVIILTFLWTGFVVVYVPVVHLFYFPGWLIPQYFTLLLPTSSCIAFLHFFIFFFFIFICNLSILIDNWNPKSRACFVKLTFCLNCSDCELYIPVIPLYIVVLS